MRLPDRSNHIVRIFLGAAFGLVAGISPYAGAVSTVTSSSPGYFVDISRGSDSNPGTYAQPFGTLSRLMAQLSSVRPLRDGEGAYLRCDASNGKANVWRETLVLTSAHMADGARIQGYGACTDAVKATISGSDNLSGGWERLSTPGLTCTIWRKYLPTDTPKITRLTVNGKIKRTAQWPNYIPGYYNALGILTNAQEYAITNPNTGGNLLYPGRDYDGLSPDKKSDIVGATIQIRSSAYFIEQRQVQSYDGTKFTLDNSRRGDYLKPGQGYVLQDKRWMLDTEDEFFHEVALGVNTLYVCAPTAFDMNSTAVEGSVRNNVATISGRSRLNIGDLELRMGRGDGLVLQGTSQSTISMVNAAYNGRAGIRIDGDVTNTAITRNAVYQNWIFGIDSRDAVGAHLISDNAVYDIGTEGYAGGAVPQFSTNGGGVKGGYDYISGIVAGDNATVVRNAVQRTAMSGIRYVGSATINDNDIADFCRRLTDCGAIYTWVKAADAANADLRSAQISRNRVTDGRRDLQGVLASDTAKDIVAGIYLDDYSANANVSGNVIARSPVGIYVHNGKHHHIESNWILLTSLKGIYVNVDVPANAASAGNVYRKNLVAPLSSVSGTAWDGSIGVFKGIPKSTVSHAFYATSNAASLLLASDNNLFDSNQVVLLNGANNEAAFYQQGTGPEWRLTATGWKQWNPAEAAANLVPATFSLYRLKETQPPLYSFSASTTTPLPWRGASGFASSAYTPYLIRFKAKFSSLVRIRPQFTAVITGTTTTYTPIAFDTSTHWSGLAGLGTVTGSSGEMLTYEGFVMPTSGATDTRYELGRVGGDMSSVGLLSAEVRKLEGYTVPSATTWMSLQSASRWAAKVIPDCAALGWSSGCQVIDMMGNPVSLPTTLPAGAVALYLNKNPAW